MAKADPFVTNRAEELGQDVWKRFVVPPFFDKLGIHSARKPSVIQGGRGCGKTMLLRYLSHRSTFSPDRGNAISLTECSRIGLYWKADTQFARTLHGRGIEPEVWRSAFTHGMALRLAQELLHSLKSITHSIEGVMEGDVAGMRLASASDFDPTLPDTVEPLGRELTRRWRRFCTWVNNPRTVDDPVFLPCMELLRAMVDEVQSRLSLAEVQLYMVYIDEYENLLPNQQRLINTYLKSSEPPVIFNIAAKRNAFRERRTLSDESIVDPDDYRTIDIESEFADQFPVFAAEVMFLNIALCGDELGLPDAEHLPVRVADLRDPSALDARRDLQYQRRVLDAVEKVLPGMSHSQLAEAALGDVAIRAKLERELSDALRRRNSSISPEQFVVREHPMATVVVPSLLNRESLTPAEVEDELKALVDGRDNRFTGRTDWVHNNFIGCLLRLYTLSSRTCPVYGGFQSFLRLANGNLRHFLELCYKSFMAYRGEPGEIAMSVPSVDQALAAHTASSDFLREVRRFGPQGNSLHTFVLTLGSIFALSQDRPSQSEPEVRHFAVVSGREQLNPSDEEFLSEAVKWSVLFEEPETKKKMDMLQSGIQWVLNPIYSPYFRITYRKGRKLDLTTDELITLIRGSYDQRRALLREYQRKWALTQADVSPTLFSHLEGA